MSEAHLELARRDTAASQLPQDRYARDVVCVLGLPFDTGGVAETVDKLRAAALSNTRCFVSTPNLHFAIAAQRDPAFRDSVLRSDLSVPDGAPIVWAARRLGLPMHERVAGSTVFEALRAHPGPPLTVYFFGGAPGVAQAACRSLNAERGGLRCVGYDAPGFGSVEEMSTPRRIEQINRSGAQFVVVSLGAKKGQAWIERNAPALAAPLLCHLGAVINFVAGTVTRAPAWAQRAGLEWLWRIKEEPGLWRRYRDDGLAFARIAPTLLGNAGRRREADALARPATLETSVADDGVLAVRLAGAWVREHLGPLRVALAEAAARSCSVRLFMSEVSAIDGYCVGLLLLARGNLGEHGLHLVEVPAVVRAALARHAASYLLAVD